MEDKPDQPDLEADWGRWRVLGLAVLGVVLVAIIVMVVILVTHPAG